MALRLIKSTIRDFFEDDCPTRAAALSYYTVFSLPPLLVLILTLIGFVWDEQAIQRALEGQFAEAIGREAALQIHTMIENANRPGEGGPPVVVLGVAGLLFGATGVVLQLQRALNRVWEVGPDPDRGGILRFLMKRVFSLLMIVAIALLLLASLILSAALSAFSDIIAEALGGVPSLLLSASDILISLVVVAPLFALVYRFLPDARIAWRDALIGGVLTAVLFVAGKLAIGFYPGQSQPGQAFGAAGALAILLLWIYYSGLILLLGAEFTQTWSRRRGVGIRPARGAVRLVVEERRVG